MAIKSKSNVVLFYERFPLHARQHGSPPGELQSAFVVPALAGIASEFRLKPVLRAIGSPQRSSPGIAAGSQVCWPSRHGSRFCSRSGPGFSIPSKSGRSRAVRRPSAARRRRAGRSPRAPSLCRTGVPAVAHARRRKCWRPAPPRACSAGADPSLTKTGPTASGRLRRLAAPDFPAHLLRPSQGHPPSPGHLPHPFLLR